MPFRLGDNLAEDVCGGLRAFVARNLTSLEEAVRPELIYDGRGPAAEETYKIRDSIEASKGWLLKDLIKPSRVGTWDAWDGAMALSGLERGASAQLSCGLATPRRPVSQGLCAANGCG